MLGRRLATAQGYTVGDVLMISAEPFDSRVSRISPMWASLEWPWAERDPESKNSWHGTMGFPLDPDDVDWQSTPWRVEPHPSEMGEGDPCMIGIPPTRVRVTAIEHYDPPADYGWLPRPEYALVVVPVDADEDGYLLYLNSGEPIDIQVIDRR
ncbi:hypothetical protein AB0F72_09675 [Actinoplanes sp. NPDC023936]|uniref:hypothetical protein n=1 Tax=Actinoplanes sp. NPDC023936 TaxID=3154910 RepID=UPI0033D6E0F6